MNSEQFDPNKHLALALPKRFLEVVVELETCLTIFKMLDNLSGQQDPKILDDRRRKFQQITIELMGKLTDEEIILYYEHHGARLVSMAMAGQVMASRYFKLKANYDNDEHNAEDNDEAPDIGGIFGTN